MQLTTKSLKVSLDLDENKWSLLQQLVFDDENLGEMFLGFSVEENKEVNVDKITKSRSILKFIYEKYTEGAKTSPFNSLKVCLSSLKENFNEITSAGIIVFTQNTVYVAAFGGAEILIYRNKSLSKILASGDSVIAASGFPKDKDLMFIATKEFGEDIGFGDLRDILTHASSDLDSLKKDLTEGLNHASAALEIVGFTSSPQTREIEKVDLEMPAVHTEGSIAPSDSIRLGERKILSQFSLGGLLSRLPSRKRKEISVDTVQDEDPRAIQKKKMTMTVGVIIIILLIVSISFGAYQKNTKEKISLYKPRLTEAQHNFDESLNLLTLSPERARDHFLKSRELVDALFGEGVVDEDLSKLDINLKENQGKVLGEYENEAQSFIDLSLLSDGFEGDDLSISDEVIYVLDRNKERVVSIAISSKKSEAVAGPGAAAESLNIASFADRVYVGKEDGVYQVDISKEKIIDEELGNNYLMYAYSGNIYIVDKSNSTIKRYSAFEGGVTSGSSWLAESAEPDLSKVTSMTIDGTIWMVSSTGGVFKFSLGNQVNFSISGLFPEIEMPTQIYSNDELKYLYLLEPSKERIIVLTKEGSFVAQYVAKDLSNAKDFGVSEKEKKAVFLSDGRLMYVDLGHLE